jgi:septal ring factor EnvC (AmiA/AmiB activator)
MSEWDQRNEPHVSPDEMRAALAPRRESRRNPVLVSERSAQADAELHDLRTALESARADEGQLREALDRTRSEVDAARADAIELRAALDAARGDAAELRGELAGAKADLRERRQGLERLAAARAWRRRKVLGDLRSRGLV